MGIDVGSLTPEEREAILEAAKTLQEEPQDPIQVVASALDLLMAKVEAIEEKLDGVCKVVYDDFIGGINDLASEKAKTDRIGGLKEKYSGLFGGYSDYLGDHLDGNPDQIYDLLDEHIEKLKQEGGDSFTPETGDAEIQRIAKEIGDRVAKLTGKPAVVESPGAEPVVANPEEGGGKAPPPAMEEKKEEPPKSEQKKEEPPKEEEDPMKGLKEHIGKLRERGGQAA